MKRPRQSLPDSPLFNPENGASPILRQSTRISGCDSDSDEEIIFTAQANKKRKMASDEAMRIWFSNELQKNLKNIAT